MHAIMKFRMRQRDSYKRDVPHPLPLDGKCQMSCSLENKQSRVYKIGVHFDLQNASIFPLEVTWNTYGTCVFQLRFLKLTGRYNGATETHYILKVILLFFVLAVN